MLNTRIRLQRMASQSLDVLLHPESRVFHAYAARSSDSDALTYVAIAAFLTAILSMLAARGGSAIGLMWSIVDQLFAFYIFAGIIYFFGHQRGGIGNFEQIAYSFALFYVPIQVLVWLLTWLLVLTPVGLLFLPWLWLVQLVGYGAKAYYAHLAVKAVMGFRRAGDAWVAVGAGLVTLLIIELALSRGFMGM